jgi:hypothetical protein
MRMSSESREVTSRSDSRDTATYHRRNCPFHFSDPTTSHVLVCGRLVKPSGTPSASNAGQRPANEGHDKALLNTMAKKNAKILSALSPRNLGAGSIWDSAMDEPAPGDTEAARGRSRPGRGAHANARSTSPKSKKKHGNRSTSVPANSRANLLDNNVLGYALLHDSLRPSPCKRATDFVQA